VYIATRNSSKAATVIAELQQLTGNSAKFLPLDLADLGSIKTAANEFMSKESELHVLFNNAGVMNSPIEDVTKDGYDLQFGTNVLGRSVFATIVEFWH
jgi:retinol dehydrogenase-12